MDTQDSRLVLRDYPLLNWIIAVILLGLGFPYLRHLLAEGAVPGSILAIIEIVGGLALLLTGSILTVTADRATRILTLEHRSLLKESRVEIPFAEIAAIQLEMTSSRGSETHSGPTYRIVVVRVDGQKIPFHSYSSSGTRSKSKKVERLRAFVGVGGADISLHGTMQALSQMAQQKYQEQQEALTGSEAEEQTTDGVHWKVQTAIFGGTPVTRWFSPDFQIVGGFLYLAQKVEGSSGSVLTALDGILYRGSLRMYGFGDEDAPGLARAELLTPLHLRLEPHFTAYTSNPDAARQILNPWLAAPLGDWGMRHPLKQFQRPNTLGQLVVMFSPRGVYAATLGTRDPEALAELTKLGVELVRAQGSPLSRGG